MTSDPHDYSGLLSKEEYMILHAFQSRVLTAPDGVCPDCGGKLALRDAVVGSQMTMDAMGRPIHNVPFILCGACFDRQGIRDAMLDSVPDAVVGWHAQRAR